MPKKLFKMQLIQGITKIQIFKVKIENILLSSSYRKFLKIVSPGLKTRAEIAQYLDIIKGKFYHRVSRDCHRFTKIKEGALSKINI